MSKFSALGLSFDVPDAAMRADLTDEDYKMLLLLAIDSVARGLEANLTGGEIVADSVSITNGASSVTVTFATAFDTTPVITGLTVVKPGAGSDDITPFGVHTLSPTGFTVVLSASAPSSGYTLHYSAK